MERTKWQPIWRKIVAGSCVIGSLHTSLLAANWLGPAVIAGNDTNHLGLLSQGQNQWVTLDIEKRVRGTPIQLLGVPTGGVIDGGGETIITCGEGQNKILVFDARSRLRRQWSGRAGCCSPVLNPRTGILYVCNRYENSVSAVNPKTGRELRHCLVLRQPIYCQLTPDGSQLVVANHLPVGRATESVLSAAVTVLEAVSLTVQYHLALPNGSTSLRELAISPDGAWCAVTHNLARFQVPTIQVESGWMNDSVLTLIDLRKREVKATVLLDEPKKAAANPWGVRWSLEGRKIVIAHSGTHEVSLIDAAALIARLPAGTENKLIDNFGVLTGIRKRLPLAGKGPRQVVIQGDLALVSEFFTDSISIIDLAKEQVRDRIQLNEEKNWDLRRRGEFLFHDATLSYQSWQACVSCHPDGRSDGLAWDLLNDGIGNPKKTKSLVNCTRTPPAMSLGVRETAEDAIRSGLRNILFASRPAEDVLAIREYLDALKPMPSLFLEKGQLSKPAKRGKKLFNNVNVGCDRCHPIPFYTDLQSHDVETANRQDKPGSQFDTPSLIEAWRNGPYLHDSSALGIREVISTLNRGDRHGRTSPLTSSELDDLAVYVLSL